MGNVFSKGDKKFFALCLVVFGVIGGGAAWYQYVNQPPVINIPPYPTLPNPNGYDLYVQAGQSISNPVPAVDPLLETNPARDPKTEAQRYSLARREAWLKQNAHGFRLFQRAMRTPSLHPPQRFAAPPPMILAKDIRQMARYKAVEANTWEMKGEWGKAAQSRLDALQMGNDVARGGPLVPALIGIVVHAIGRNGWWSHLDRLDAAECHAAIARLERIQASRIRADATMTEEKYCGQIMLRNTRPSWVFFWISRRKTMSNYVEMMDAHIANARKPYLKATPVVTPSDPLIKILAPVFTRARWNFARNDAGNSLWLVALALRAYKLENAKYPAQLTELTPKYLKDIPADPFGAGEALRYKNRGTEYLLYSIGPDGVDNGGKPIPHPAGASATRRKNLPLVVDDSKGDYVAGKNR
jgi:hypothetical protein